MLGKLSGKKNQLHMQKQEEGGDYSWVNSGKKQRGVSTLQGFTNQQKVGCILVSC